MTTFVWVPRRMAVYAVESNPIMDAFSGERPVQDFLAALCESDDGRPHELYTSVREVRHAIERAGAELREVSWHA